LNKIGSAITTQVNRTPITPALFSMPEKLIAKLSGPEQPGDQNAIKKTIAGNLGQLLIDGI